MSTQNVDRVREECVLSKIKPIIRKLLPCAWCSKSNIYIFNISLLVTSVEKLRSLGNFDYVHSDHVPKL